MTLFRTTRIKLTLWYLLIIMLISISFSFVVYRMVSLELDRIERMQRDRLTRRFPQWIQEIKPDHIPDTIRPPRFIEAGDIDEAKKRLTSILVLVNITILGTSAIAGYFLAGKTLRPIKTMMDEQNRFIADASHELRTPLTSLKTETEVALRDKKLEITEAKTLLKSNLEEINKLQLLSDNLIKLVQFKKSTKHIIQDKVQLNEVILESIRVIKGIAKAKSITINYQQQDITLRGNTHMLVELFTILLDNAIKYSPEHTKIYISTKSHDKNVIVKVKDEGIGIDSKDIPHVFDRFYRADQSRTKSSVPGYGLGLSIAKEIVGRHKGDIWAASEKGNGSEFIVKLPLYKI